MKHKKIAAGLVTLAMTFGIATSALAEVVQRTLTMDTTADRIQFQDVNIGDTLHLTLVNPTNRTLVFQTSQRLGEERSWSVPPNSSRTITYTYTEPFDRDVNFVVNDPAAPGMGPIAEGLLLPVRTTTGFFDQVGQRLVPGQGTQLVTIDSPQVQVRAQDQGYGRNLASGLGQGVSRIVAAPFQLVTDLGVGLVNVAAAPFSFVGRTGHGVADVVAAPFGVPPTYEERVPLADAPRVVQATPGSGVIAMGDPTNPRTLTLVNPTDQPLTFHTTVNGMVKSWNIPANSQRTIAFEPGTIPSTLAYTITEPGVTVAMEPFPEPVAVTEAPPAVPEVYRQSITLSPQAPTGELDFTHLNVGDRVELTLVNPTNEPLRFDTTHTLGIERSWVVPPQSQRVITYTHAEPLATMPTQYQVSAVPAVTPDPAAVRGFW